jgi:FKBP-type peptidyl-prolyl cis-trans isomerase
MRFRLISFVTLLAAITACEPTAPAGPSDPATDSYAASLGVDIPSMVKLYPDLYYKDITVGTGTTASYGKTVYVQYTGYLTDGTVFDSQVGTDSIAVTLLDDGNLIVGWVYGVPGMKVGGTRKLVIGSNFAYGPKGRQGIPPNATLVFDITLKSVK